GNLEGPRHAEPDPAVDRQAGDVFAEQQNAAGADWKLTADQVEQGRLAGPVRSDHRLTLALTDGQSHVPDGQQAAEGLGDRPELESGGASERELPIPPSPAPPLPNTHFLSCSGRPWKERL